MASYFTTSASRSQSRLVCSNSSHGCFFTTRWQHGITLSIISCNFGEALGIKTTAASAISTYPGHIWLRKENKGLNPQFLRNGSVFYFTTLHTIASHRVQPWERIMKHIRKTWWAVSWWRDYKQKRVLWFLNLWYCTVLLTPSQSLPLSVCQEMVSTAASTPANISEI